MANYPTANMPKAAYRYDFYLPLKFNDGRPIPDERFSALERDLLGRFGGVTALQRDFPLRGAWQCESQLYLDEVVVLTALDFRKRGSAEFIARVKRELLRAF